MSNSKYSIPYTGKLHCSFHAEPHPLLAQIPLTVSPYIHLPRAPTLPYTYKHLPSTLPPSSTADPNGIEREKYVVAPSGHTAHPDEILKSCQALQAHIVKVQVDAQKMIADWQKDLKDQELAEKRRVAPGWLDREEKILQPTRTGDSIVAKTEEVSNQVTSLMDQDDSNSQQQSLNRPPSNPGGEELDRAFGGMGLKQP